MLDATDNCPTTDQDEDDRWTIAGAEFRRHIDNDLRKRSRDGKLPWERTVAVGQVDYWLVHAWALDRLDELLGVMLPDGAELPDVTWRGRHHEGAPWIVVSLLTGAWSEPASGKHGGDLVGLVARIYGMPMRRAAIRLASWLGIKGVRRG